MWEDLFNGFLEVQIYIMVTGSHQSTCLLTTSENSKISMENNKNTTDTISTLQIQVDDVKNVMTKNIDKVLQREEKLSELVDRTDDLQIADVGRDHTKRQHSRA
ncbi:vesicle-associated membrane protein 7-like isoform X1 [Alligator sinensis]|uniref:Vesicle-associated membrane protein 7-like isoform X1 n=1 Tax=Alligator sinensis TaxID=38654 RepID=A0A3Q0FJ07_ALLSI|nr:vesicle-associated membrane protein 7-like isoform X1 [Alligator sinensis]